jgi:hypothetical protein
MPLYAFHDLILEVQHAGQETGLQVAQLLQELSLVRLSALSARPCLCLSVRMNDGGSRPPPLAREVFRANGIQGLEVDNDFYLTDGSSLLHLQPLQGQGEAQLASAFFAKPLILQVDFLAFGLIKLFRPLGLFGLHAAGVVTHEGLGGLLIVGASGSGKSTLAVGLVRQGWSYLSDEVVLLRLQPQGVEALAMRKGFYVDASTAMASGSLPLGEDIAHSFGRRKRRVRIEEAYPRQYLPQCIPRVLLYSHIVPQEHSAVRPLDRLTALKHLLMQSGPLWFDRGTMAHQLEVLNRLLLQTAAYELGAGRDLYRDPLLIVRLLTDSARAN